MRKSTPWGQADFENELAPGIIDYGTPGHGGIWLSAERRKALNYDKNWLKTAEWWEEDCDWSVPYYFFREDIRAGVDPYKFDKNLQAAIETAKRHHPEFAQREGLI